MGQGPLDLMQELQKAITALTSFLCWAKLSSSPPPNIHFLGLYNKDFNLMTCTFILAVGFATDGLKPDSATCNNTVVYDASPQTMIPCLMLARKDLPFFFYLVSRTNFSHLKYSHGPQLVLPLHLDERFHPNSVVTSTYLILKYVHPPQSFFCVPQLSDEENPVWTQALKQLLPLSSPFSTISLWKVPPTHFLSYPWLLVSQGHFHNPELSIFCAQSM